MAVLCPTSFAFCWITEFCLENVVMMTFKITVVMVVVRLMVMEVVLAMVMGLVEEVEEVGHLSTPWLEEASSLSLAARSRLWIPRSSE